MSIWNVVQNLGQTISGAIGEAIDTTVSFVNDLPESEVPEYTVRSYEVTHYTPEPESQSATESQSPLSSAMHRLLYSPTPLIKTIKAESATPDVTACVPWFFGGDSECMNEADEFLPLIGTITIAAGAVAAGAAIAGAGTTTVITEATPYIPWIPF